MSRIDKRKLRKMILKEFKMIGMSDMGSFGRLGQPHGGHMGYDSFQVNHYGCDACGQSPCACDEYEDFSHGGHQVSHGHGSVSRESCCEAVLCLIECCECPETKARLRQCCEDLLR